MKSFLFAVCCAACIMATAQNKSGYAIKKTFHIPSVGGWDYLAVNGNKLYVSHGTQVNILDKTTGDSLSFIPNTTGVHGIAFDNSNGKGYTSNGRLNNVSVFNLNTNEVTAQIATGENPDAIMYDDFSKKIITCNGRSNDLTVIDVATQKVVATIAVGGKPETAVTDLKGKWYVNIEDKSEIVEVNATTFKVENHWSVAPGNSPTGLAFDTQTHQLFAGCDNKLLIVMDAVTGKINQQLPIGDGCDGVAFDESNKTIFTSNGEGTMTIAQMNQTKQFAVIENLPTKKRARTIAIDAVTHIIYLPTAEFEPLPADAGEKARPKMIPGSFQVLMIGK